MNKVKIFLSSSTLLFLSLFFPLSAGASYSPPPDFGHCPSVNGTIVASYQDGWHWIVGNSNLQWGSDTVFSINNGNFTQCFCPKNHNSDDHTALGLGTQTDWLKASNINSDTQSFLLKTGWILVPDGSVFGLDSGPYLAKNSNFVCNTPGCNIHVNQQSTTDLKTTVHNSLNTGDNTSSNSTHSSIVIHTGDSQTSSQISNLTNINKLQLPSIQHQTLQLSITNNGSLSENIITAQ